MRPKTLLAPALGVTMALAAPLPVLAAGLVEVRFVEPQNYRDAGRGLLERERTTRALAEHLQRWAPRLGDGQTLKIDVLDVDLAGEMQFTRSAHEIRVLRGRADWPRIEVQWSLEAGGKTLQQGKETVVDMAYTLGTPVRVQDGPLPYEARMLDRWLAERVLAAQAQ